MSTRSLTIFKTATGETIATMYRHHDGYPEGHGKDLADFLHPYKLVNGISDPTNVFNGMGCLAAAVVAHLKSQVPGLAGGISLIPTHATAGEEYTYILSPAAAEGGIHLRITKEGRPNQVIFNGNIRSFNPND